MLKQGLHELTWLSLAFSTIKRIASEHFVCSHLALVCSQFGPSARAQRSAGGKVAEMQGGGYVFEF